MDSIDFEIDPNLPEEQIENIKRQIFQAMVQEKILEIQAQYSEVAYDFPDQEEDDGE